MGKVKIVSPLAPSEFPTMPPIAGVEFATGVAGIRYSGRKDLLLAVFPAGTTVAGSYTQSLTASAPVLWCREAQRQGKVRALVINSGNSNAFTGKLGVASVERTVKATAKLLRCHDDEVLIASTGVIGEPLPDQKITNLLPELYNNLGSEARNWRDAAESIMTTDTFPKGATVQCEIDGVPITINGFAKGSGMIAPDMATMLGFVFTDANLDPDILQDILNKSVDRSFNCITVDGDTSTSDTMIMVATGKARHEMITRRTDSRLRAVRAALDQLMIDLAQQVARDGEGAEKFITITVTGASSEKSARIIGLAIANSPLVKTAIAGEDANWGRIVMAVGKSGQKADRDKLAISIGGVLVASQGQRVEDYDETPVAAHVKTRNVVIEVDVGIADGKATVWTCDLTHRYIDINGGYRS
ncbi:MAG: bifunctional glutamate N-acetyltransferase/amino-acid acetyltransferase ArgJ [Candidatus Pacebacteria bacterium]|nr:bifunctional glutamate N-acetyltransferase/amino-acid acetyltransferase ArgJ [Candidatus Paceibacterota bacterium]